MRRHATAAQTPEPITDIHSYVETALQLSNANQAHEWNRTIKGIKDVDLHVLRQGSVDLDMNQYASKESLQLLLKESQSEFHKQLAAISAVEPLYEYCVAFVAEQQEALFYHHNDLIFARAQQEMLNGFLDALLPRLQQDGLLTDEQMEKFNRLRAVQSLGFDAYANLRAIMIQRTDDENPSLIKAATEQLANHPLTSRINTGGAGAHQTVIEASYALARQIAHEQYNLNLPDDMVVPPLFFALFDATYHLAALQVKAEHPHIDLRDPLQRNSQALLDEKYVQLFDEIKKRAYDTTDDYVFVELAEELKTRIAQLDNSPDNLGELAEKAAAKAFTTTESRARHYLQEDRKKYLSSTQPNGKRARAPRSHAAYAESVQNYGSAAQLVKFTGYLKAEAPKLKNAECFDQCYAILANQLTALVDEVMFHWTPPAMLLAYQDYLAEFQANMNQSLGKTSQQNAGFNTRLNDLRSYAEHAYRARGIMGDWVRADTNNGTDDLFEMVMAQSFTDPKQLSVETQRLYAKTAREIYQGICIAKGIPDFLSENPIMPLLLLRSINVAEEEALREATTATKEPEPTEESPKPLHPSWHRRVHGSQRGVYQQRVRINQVFSSPDPDMPTSDYETPSQNPPLSLEKRAGKVLSDALARVRDADGNLDFSPHGIALMFEYLDAREGHARPTHTAGRTH